MDIDPTWPEWVLRQDFACVFVRAPSPAAAVKLAAKRLGHMGGWKVDPDADPEVFPWEEYREHARPGDYTRSVIIGSRSQPSVGSSRVFEHRLPGRQSATIRRERAILSCRPD